MEVQNDYKKLEARVIALTQRVIQLENDNANQKNALKTLYYENKKLDTSIQELRKEIARHQR